MGKSGVDTARSEKILRSPPPAQKKWTSDEETRAGNDHNKENNAHGAIKRSHTTKSTAEIIKSDAATGAGEPHSTKSIASGVAGTTKRAALQKHRAGRNNNNTKNNARIAMERHTNTKSIGRMMPEWRGH